MDRFRISGIDSRIGILKLYAMAFMTVLRKKKSWKNI